MTIDGLSTFPIQYRTSIRAIENSNYSKIINSSLLVQKTNHFEKNSFLGWKNSEPNRTKKKTRIVPNERKNSSNIVRCNIRHEDLKNFDEKKTLRLTWSRKFLQIVAQTCKRYFKLEFLSTIDKFSLFGIRSQRETTRKFLEKKIRKKFKIASKKTRTSHDNDKKMEWLTDILNGLYTLLDKNRLLQYDIHKD